MEKFCALLIEDDEDDYILTLDFLEEIRGEDVKLDWAKSADEAREYFKTHSHDICLMDYRLGSETGVELLKQAIESGYETPIIMLTGQKDKSVDHSASQAGAADYLLKSELNAENLDRSIRYALSRREIQKARLESLRSEEKSQFKTEFLAHLSHELRTPLTAILGFAENLSNTLSKPENKEKVDIIYQNGRHLLSLLNDVLDISKIEAGKLSIERCNIDLFVLIEEIYALMSAHASDKNLGFELISRGQLPRFINTDPKRLKQIALNLITNAIKFTPRGSVTVELFLSPENPDLLNITVIDTGIGINEKDLNKIFEAFERASDTPGRLSQGTGLGLTISKQLAEKLGGSISINSTEGYGSAFTLLTDISPYSTNDLADFTLKGRSSITLNKFTMPKFSGKVLLVDDMRDIRVLVSDLLEQSGLNVDTVENGLQALEACKELQQANKAYDLILMDIDMPYLDGFETAKAIRDLNINSPIVAFTAAMMGETQEKCDALALDGLLKKPIETEELIQILQRFFGKQAEGNNTKSKQTGKNLLIVEDSADAAKAQAMLCEILGYEAAIANSYQSALDFIDESSGKTTFDIAFIDKNLPDGSGLELAKAFKQASQQTRIFIVSGEVLENSDPDAIEACLLKPIGLDTLKQLL